MYIVFSYPLNKAKKEPIMAISRNQLYSIDKQVEGDILIVQLRKRPNVDTPWDQAEIVDERRFDCSEVPLELKDGNGYMKPHMYGIWKCLQERVSDVPLPEKLERKSHHFENFVNGYWKIPVARVAQRVITAYEIQAIANLQNWPLTKAQAALEALDAPSRVEILDSSKVRAEIAKLKAEVAAIDTKELLKL